MKLSIESLVFGDIRHLGRGVFDWSISVNVNLYMVPLKISYDDSQYLIRALI